MNQNNHHGNGDDSELVRKAATGDRSAFEELVRRTSRLVYARVYLETGDPHRTEDILQETYMQAMRAIGKLREPGGFRPWLLSIAHNLMIDHARKNQRRKRIGDDGEDAHAAAIVSTAPSPAEEMQRQELRQQVLAVLRSLPEEQRIPLTLRYIVGADYETIGTQLGLTNGALRGLMHRGLRLLRERLPAPLRPDFSNE